MKSVRYLDEARAEFLHEVQYFSAVSPGWLKDRKGRTLSKDDLTHYRKVVVALSETIRLMAEIDRVIEAHGGWPGAFQTATKA